MDIPRYDTRDFDPQTEIGYLRQTSVRETAPLHTHQFFEIFLITEGRALHLVNDAVQNLEKGDLVLIRPDDCHCYDFYRTFDFQLINVAFTVEAMAAVAGLFAPRRPLEGLTSLPLPPVAHLSEEDTAAASRELSSIGRLRDTVSPEYARCYFRGLLAMLLCRHFLAKETGKAAAPSWLASAVTQMQSIENFRAGLPRMVELCRCSEEHLCREFRKYYRTTPVSYINAQRLGYSLYLLSNTELTILQVAEQCGFGNLSHFYRLFRERFGTSPRKYRNHSAAG